MRAMRTAVFIVFTFVAGTLSAAESPMRVAGANTVDTRQAYELFKNGALFVDVRRDSDWGAGRIAGAVHIELKKVFSAAALGAEAGKDEAIVIYCNGPKCPRSAAACEKAVAWGYGNVHYFRDGLPAWQAAGFPTE